METSRGPFRFPDEEGFTLHHVALTLTDADLDTLERWRKHLATCPRCVRAGSAMAALTGCKSGFWLTGQAAAIIGRQLDREAGDQGAPEVTP